ncbi:hypothetical protein [uncultured Desulfovibrio sp.]|uniref:helix-turn-helix domain-containing protein n=1 Tax=uncultured Desulfovibrio sp. TaxID=167968 RepID=UPI0026094095|nr:hypothetical protein [uncultured Desulfovibrio sp.]
MNYLEHGVVEPRARTLIRLADALAVPPDELFARFAKRLREQGLEEPGQTRSVRPRRSLPR